MSIRSVSPDSFTTFGDLLKFLRRRERLTQLELSIEVGYSEAQISRLEKNQRLPDLASLKALFLPALHLDDEPEVIQRMLDLAQSARQEDLPAPGTPPYKGLLFFEERDADLFFGRKTLTARLAARVHELVGDPSLRFLAIVGASGSGKSSLVRAGLIPNLAQAGWETRVFTPTEHPLKTLEASLHSIAIREASECILILVDQFEEVFTLCRDESARIGFIEKLLALAQDPARKTVVVITLRADFYSYCAQYPQLRKAVAVQQEYIGQMSASELRQAIEWPARVGGWDLEPGLVEILLQEIGAYGANEPEPGALPLLSHALLATWERRRGKLFTVAGYRACGGVRGAIAETAESVYKDQLNEVQRQYARDIFLRMTELGQGTEDTRRRVTLAELVPHAGEAAMLRGVLNTLSEARLITIGEDSAEVAHEALIREWQRLREWLNEDREGLRLHRNLTEAAHEWETLGRDPGDLYRGARLAQAREWVQSNQERLNESERAFLTASTQQEEQEAQERETLRQRELAAAQKLAREQAQRAEEQLRATRQIRRGAIFLAAALCAALILAGATLFFNRKATENAQAAMQTSRVATSRELASSSISQLETDPELSILLGLQALKVTLNAGLPPLAEAQSALHRALQTSRIQMTIRGDTADIVGIAVSSDGTHIASLSRDGALKVWGLVSGKEELTIQTGMPAPFDNLNRSISFSPDGKLLAAPAGNHLAKVWEVTSGQEMLILSGHTGEITAIAYSPDGSRLATASLDGTAKIWDARTGLVLLNVQASDGSGKAAVSHPAETRLGVNAVAFSPDGNLLATGNIDGNSAIWTTATGQELFTFPNTDTVTSVAFSPNGAQVATGNYNSVWNLWDASTGNKLVTGYGHSSLVNQVVFDHTGKRLATASADGTARLWEAATGRELITLSGHVSGVWGVAFTPDDEQLITGSFDKTIKVWDLSPQAGREWVTLVGNTGRIYDVAYSPDGKYIVSAGDKNFIELWDSASGKEIKTFQGDFDFVGGVAFSPDGKLVFAATGSSKKDGAVIEWDIETGNRIQVFSCNACVRLAISRDGRLLATSADLKGAVKLWDVHTGKELFTLNGHAGFVQGLAFSPDGRRLATVSEDGSFRAWDVNSGKTIYILSGKIGLFRVAFSPDGKLLATSGNDAAVHIWDAASGKSLYVLTGHTGTTFGVAFSPDGRYLATSSVDRTVKIWEVAAGENAQPLTLEGHTAAIYTAAFSSDGTHLVTASRDGTARVYALRLEDLMMIAKTRVTRGFSTGECQRFLHLSTCSPIE